MKKRLHWILMMTILLTGISWMVLQNQQIKQDRVYEDKRQEVMDQIFIDLSHYHPDLAAYINQGVTSVVASEISREGFCEFEAALLKDQEPFGQYILKVDLNKMKVINEEVMVTNTDYAEEWRLIEGNE